MARERAERSFLPQIDRAEKGSAMTIIRAETAASNEKSARLKALRLARDATAAPAPKKPARAAAKR